MKKLYVLGSLLVILACGTKSYCNPPSIGADHVNAFGVASPADPLPASHTKDLRVTNSEGPLLLYVSVVSAPYPTNTTFADIASNIVLDVWYHGMPSNDVGHTLKTE